MEHLTLSNLRKKKGLTQRDLAKKCEMSPSAIAMYERGKRTPTLKRAKVLAEFFNVSVEKIFFENNVHDMRAKRGA